MSPSGRCSSPATTSPRPTWSPPSAEPVGVSRAGRGWSLPPGQARPGPASAAAPGSRACAPGGRAGDHRVGGNVLGDDGVAADDRVVADADAAQDAGAVTDPDIGADLDLAGVDALLADRPLDLHDAVVEVDEHRPVGDHALFADPHPPVSGDRALLSHHGLGADLDCALVTADLGPVADPGEAAELDPAPARNLQFEPAAEEDGPVGAPAPAGGGEQAAPQVATEQQRVFRREHPVAGAEAEEADHGGRDFRLAHPCPTPPRISRSPPPAPGASSRATRAPWRG